MGWNISFSNIVKRIGWLGTKRWFEIWTSDSDFSTDAKKLNTIIKSPAGLFIFALLPDLASMGQFKLYREEDVEFSDPEKKHPLLDYLNNPNPLQTKEQFIWDYMFWRLTGSANLLTSSKILRGDQKDITYWLSPDCIKWPRWFEDNRQTLFFSKAALKELEEKEITYETANQKYPFKYKMLKQFFDLSNGLKGWFEPPSRLDAILKIIVNSNNVLDSKNTTSHLARKFIVAGKHDVNNTSTLPMENGEKNDIQSKIFSNRAVHPMKSMIDIKRFLNNLGELQELDKTYMNDVFLIAKTIGNIPKDVIENFQSGSTYENQEKGKAAIISYCVQPAMDDFCRGVLDFFQVGGYVLKADYSHLPFVQTFEEQKATTRDKNATAFLKLVSGGVKQEEAAEACGFDFTPGSFTEPKNLGSSSSSDDQKLQKHLERLEKLMVV